METLSLIQHIESLFKQIEKFTDKEGRLFVPKILEAIERIDSDLVKLLLNDTKAKEQFFMKIEDVYVLNQNELIEFFTMNEYFNHSFTSYSNKIGLIRKDNFIKKFDDVVLAFPYKDCVLEGGQSKEDEKKNEVFYNSIISRDEIDRLFEPKVLTNIRRYDENGEHTVEEINEEDNLIIKGNNLLALHSLKKKYTGKVKLIYIDPPYNTGNDGFQYNDNFNHSTWLTFMKNRLETSKELLSEDGVIFVQCDDNEQAYLKVLMDEVFYQENFNNTISILSSTPSGTKTAHRTSKIIKTKDTILVYSKNKSLLTLIPQYTLQNKWDTHFNLFLDRGNLEIKSFQQVIIDNNIYDKSVSQKEYDLNYEPFKKFVFKYRDNICQTGKSMPEDIRKESLKYKDKVIPYKDTNDNQQFAYNGRRLSFLSNSIHQVLKKVKNKYIIEEDISKLVCDFWDDIDFNNTQNEGGISFPAGKKPEQLLYRIISLTTQPNDLVLDFHLGSGTTCSVAHKMGRRYIGIEQMDYIEDIAVERMKKVIAGEQGGVSKALEWSGGGSFIYAELKTIDNFAHTPIAKLNKNMQYLPISEIEDEEYGISQEEIALNKKFYGLDDE